MSDIATEPRTGRWFHWLIGAALLGAVLIVALQSSDVTELLRLLRQVSPGWLLLAAAAQAFTYVSESFVWRSVTSAAGARVSLATAYQLSIAKLFVDQAVPTGGLSGTLVYVEGLRRSGVAHGVAISGVVVDAFSYYCAYALCVACALVIAAGTGYINGPLAAIAVLFAIFSTVFSVGMLLQVGWWSGPLHRLLDWNRHLARVLELLRAVDPAIAHSPRVLSRALLWQASIQLADALTIWLLLRALGIEVDLHLAFTSYMFSALFRTVSFSPGGLGTYEAASVVILRNAGVPIEAALSATLLFRLLNFWLPMLPGLWCANRIARRAAPFDGAGPVLD